MKTFSAKEFHAQPAKVYRAADLDGEVRINNSRYADKMFYLSTKERAEDVQALRDTEVKI